MRGEDQTTACDRSYSSAASEQRQRLGAVVTHLSSAPNNSRNHEAVTRRELARRLARLKRIEFAGEYDPGARYPGPLYFLPCDTLVGRDEAAALGVRSEEDLFGGIVPHRFVATKSITHPLVDANACAPRGWSHEFARRVADSALNGFAAFTRDDARRAAERLLRQGPIRIKRSLGIGGQGQFALDRIDALNGILDKIDSHEIATCGIAIEENLVDVTTCSVGQVRVAGFIATYYGTQRSTTNNAGTQVYGGSELLVVRGDFETLLLLPLSDNARLAVAQARIYDDATRCFDGFLASRRNFDVAQGNDAQGRWRSGVLEQSWRVGGASGAEIGALEAFDADPAVQVVRARTVEVYGRDHEPPPHAAVYFHGDDEHVGPLTKYTLVSTHANRR
jgi:hypothetical protein